jgi:type IV secretion system protein VirB6
MITAFVSNAGGYLTSLSEALQGLKDGFSGGLSVWATLDTLWESTQHLATDVYQADSSWAPLEGGLGMMLVWAGSMVLMLVSSVVFLSADLTMKFMLITAPIFIFCLMFGFLRPMFNNWLQLIFSSILTVLFASIVIRLAVDFQADMAAQVNAGLGQDEGNIVTIGAMGAVTGLLAAALVGIAAGFAQKLAGAGAEGAIQGMAMAGIMKAAKPIGKAAAKGAGKAAGGAGDMLAKVGDKAASNLQGSAPGNAVKARSKAAVENMKAYTASQRK